jgi:hypothetical protein
MEITMYIPFLCATALVIGGAAAPALAGGSAQHSAAAVDHSAQAAGHSAAAVASGVATVLAVPLLVTGGALMITGAALADMSQPVSAPTAARRVAPNAAPHLD